MLAEAGHFMLILTFKLLTVQWSLPLPGTMRDVQPVDGQRRLAKLNSEQTA